MRGLWLASLLVVSAVAAGETTYLTYKSVRADRELCSFFESTTGSKEPIKLDEPAAKITRARLW